jgi:hypothetical protein
VAEEKTPVIIDDIPDVPMTPEERAKAAAGK